MTPWLLRDVTTESLLFEHPVLGLFQAECVAGRFDYECMDGFGDLRFKHLEPGMGRCVRRFGPSHQSQFVVQFPLAMEGGPAVSGELLRGFVLYTPQSHRIAMCFTRRFPPVELRDVLTALFAEQKAEDSDGTGERGERGEELVPGEGRADEPAADAAEGLQGLEQHGGPGQAGGRGEAGVVQQVGADSNEAELLRTFHQRAAVPPPPPRRPKPDAARPRISP